MTKHVQKCKSCEREVSGELYHLGFSEMEAIYCESCPNVLLLKDPEFYEKHGIELRSLSPGDKGWQEYNRHLLPIFKQAESYLPKCACGGNFKYMASPRCPKCNGNFLGVNYADKPALRVTGYVLVTKEATYL